MQIYSATSSKYNQKGPKKTRVQRRRSLRELPITRLNFNSLFEEGGPSSNSSTNGKC